MADQQTNEEPEVVNTVVGEEEEVVKETAKTKGGEEELEDPELEAMRRRVREMEAEAATLREIQQHVDQEMNYPAGATADNKEDVDSRSIYVGNVDYAATAEELQTHFQACGTINRVTILCDKFTGQAKGFAYVEFAEVESVANAVVMNESVLRGRLLKVTAKRTNVPGISSTNRGGKGKGKGKGKGFYTPYYQVRGKGGFRPRRGAYYHPYY
eukprot:Lithocolla_globosa_v1_NODE_9093_length_745_cov_8.718841.p1 type:complete len:213 gc:universal NODE_9093_length_745_cov_8.718841:47-685(+)